MIEIEIYMASPRADKSEDIVFDLIDPITENSANLLLERQGASGGEYSLRKYLPPVTIADITGLPASISLDAVNILKMVKTDGKLEFFLNDDTVPFGMVESIIDSASSYWVLRFFAYDGMDEGLVFYGIRKVIIMYGPGNKLAVND